MLNIEIDAARAELGTLTEEVGAGVLAFDGDGTLWSGDVADDVVEALLGQRRLREPAAAALHAASTEHFGREESERDPYLLFAKLHAEDRAGRLSHLRMCELIGEMLAGWGVDEFHGFCIDTLRRCDLHDRLIAEAWALRATGVELGHSVLVISASPAPIVAAACELAGVPHAFAGVGIGVTNGAFDVRIQRPIPYAEGKVAAIASLAHGKPLLAAFGDNRFDLAMLAAARLPFAVRPKQALLDVAPTLPALRRLVAAG
jgi:phosphatidylglycerophosphatase C